MVRPKVRSWASSSACRISCSCRPMSRKTAFSRTKVTVVQLIRSASREDELCSRGALWASSRPAVTTASTPEASSDSAGTKAMKGLAKESAVSAALSVR